MKLVKYFLIASSLISGLHAQDDPLELVLREVQAKPELFDKVKLVKPQGATDFSVQLGESVLTTSNGEVFDGFRFTAPKNAKNLDFIWYFNAPAEWGNWYIFPVKGEAKNAFRDWLVADKVYQKFDADGVENRERILQSLSAGYFKGGAEYIMWFRQVREVEGQKAGGRLAGRFGFKKKSEKWDYKEFEQALGLKPKSAEAQVKALGSRGGRIMLDKSLFEPSYAKERIDSVFFSLRQTTRMAGGFFITMEVSIPPCKDGPAYADIVKKYGEADFVRTSKEQAIRSGDQAEDEDTTIYYYDYFGFEVANQDATKKVLRVVTHANNYSLLRTEKDVASFGQISLQNLTAFHSKEGTEVGRLYYFMEGAKEVVVTQDPPVGKYKWDAQLLDYLGNGKWLHSSYHGNGSLARKVPYEKHQMNGVAEGFHEDDSLKFKASYKNGLLDGEVIEYTPDGKVGRKTVFKEGQRVE